MPIEVSGDISGCREFVGQEARILGQIYWGKPENLEKGSELFKELELPQNQQLAEKVILKIITKYENERKKPSLPDNQKENVVTFLLNVEGISENLRDDIKKNLKRVGLTVRTQRTLEATRIEKPSPMKGGGIRGRVSKDDPSCFSKTVSVWCSVVKFFSSWLPKTVEPGEKTSKIINALGGLSKKDLLIFDKEGDPVVISSWILRLLSRFFVSDEEMVNRLKYAVQMAATLSPDQRVVLFGQLLDQSRANDKLKKILPLQPELLEDFETQLLSALVEWTDTTANKDTIRQVVAFLAQLGKVTRHREPIELNIEHVDKFDKVHKWFIQRLVAEMANRRDPSQIADMFEMLDQVVENSHFVKDPSFESALTELVARLKKSEEQKVPGGTTNLLSELARAKKTKMFLYAQAIERESATEFIKPSQALIKESGISDEIREYIKKGIPISKRHEEDLAIAVKCIKFLENEALQGRVDLELTLPLFDFLDVLRLRLVSDEEKTQLKLLWRTLNAIIPKEEETKPEELS